MLLNCGVGEDSWESLGLQEDPISPFYRRLVLGVHWKDWCWSWNSSPLATWCTELTHWKRLWCWEGLGAGGDGDDRGWDGRMASPTRWTWVWVNSGSGDGQGGLVCCSSWGHKESDTTEQMNWTELNWWQSCSSVLKNLSAPTRNQPFLHGALVPLVWKFVRVIMWALSLGFVAF